MLIVPDDVVLLICEKCERDACVSLQLTCKRVYSLITSSRTVWLSMIAQLPLSCFPLIQPFSSPKLFPSEELRRLYLDSIRRRNLLVTPVDNPKDPFPPAVKTTTRARIPYPITKKPHRCCLVPGGKLILILSIDPTRNFGLDCVDVGSGECVWHASVDGRPFGLSCGLVSVDEVMVVVEAHIDQLGGDAYTITLFKLDIRTWGASAVRQVHLPALGPVYSWDFETAVQIEPKVNGNYVVVPLGRRSNSEELEAKVYLHRWTDGKSIIIDGEEVGRGVLASLRILDHHIIYFNLASTALHVLPLSGIDPKVWSSSLASKDWTILPLATHKHIVLPIPLKSALINVSVFPGHRFHSWNPLFESSSYCSLVFRHRHDRGYSFKFFRIRLKRDPLGNEVNLELESSATSRFFDGIQLVYFDVFGSSSVSGATFLMSRGNSTAKRSFLFQPYKRSTSLAIGGNAGTMVSFQVLCQESASRGPSGLMWRALDPYSGIVLGEETPHGFFTCSL